MLAAHTACHPTFYSPSAVHNAALSYISLHSLFKPSDPSLVILDAMLCNALYKGGSRKMMRVTGTEAYLVEADPLAAELQKNFASSTTVAQVRGKRGQNEVFIQGRFLDKLSQLRVDSHGIPILCDSY
ncbi:unnamed protein product [Closterium sp. Yama58-4]|nr:unnamed protein product [Closterium sp. Yama58-4]